MDWTTFDTDPAMGDGMREPDHRRRFYCDRLRSQVTGVFTSGRITMTWRELLGGIQHMTAEQQDQTVLFVSDYFGPDRQAVEVSIVHAFEDVYVGLSVANECVVSEGNPFLASPDDDVEAGPR